MRPAARRLWPRSLAGQMALLIALALFAAQAINFALLLRERDRFRFEQATGPAVARIVDAVERTDAGDAGAFGKHEGRRHVRRLAASPVMAGEQHRPDVEAGLRAALGDAGLHVGRIETAVRNIAADDPRLHRRTGGRGERWRMARAELVIAVERPGHGWLVMNAPWPRGNWPIIWPLIAQTLILYGVILLPVLWIARRMSRPLQMLAAAAHRFTPGGQGSDAPVAERGPRDVRDVIAAFNALRLRVTAMLDEKDRMLGAIGHDLRTPLAALRVRIESVEDEDDRARMADTIADMNRTLDDILSLARLGRPSEPPVETDLAALVDAVVADFRDLGAEIGFEETPRIAMPLRPSPLRRAVRNLIENAVKYAGAAEVRIVTAERAVAIVVTDRGPGIAGEHLDHVFGAFTRLETSRNPETGGIGLGLALARAIVREGGGDITLANRAGGGLEATILLPRQAARRAGAT